MKKQRMLQNPLKAQRGASLLGWMVIAAAGVFVVVTVAKIAPVYMEFATVKAMVNEIAVDHAVSGTMSKQALHKKLADYLDVNSLYKVKPENFSVVKMPDKQNVRALQVEYETRKHWLANIDFMMSFHHVAEFERQK